MVMIRLSSQFEREPVVWLDKSPIRSPGVQAALVWRIRSETICDQVDKTGNRRAGPLSILETGKVPDMKFSRLQSMAAGIAAAMIVISVTCCYRYVHRIELNRALVATVGGGDVVGAATYLERGADIETRWAIGGATDREHTPLAIACRRGDVAMARMLVSPAATEPAQRQAKFPWDADLDAR